MYVYNIDNIYIYIYIIYIILWQPVSGTAPMEAQWQVVEAVYHRFPSDGATKSIGASQSLECGVPEEQVGKHAFKSMLPHSFRVLLVLVCEETSRHGGGVSALKNKTVDSSKAVFCSV